MSRHLDGSPKPADPIWLRQHEWLRLGCRCGHRVSLNIGTLAVRHGLHGYVRLYEVVERLRCHRCGERPSSVGILERR